MTDLRARVRGLILALPTILSLAGVPDFGPYTLHSIHELNPTITVTVEIDLMAQQDRIARHLREMSGNYTDPRLQ